MRRVYLSGPMSGIPNFNASQFNHAASFFRAFGLDIVNPVEEDAKRYDDPIPHDGEWRIDPTLYEEILTHDVEEVVPSCDAVITIDGWTRSHGASEEVKMADALEIPVFHAHRHLDVWVVYGDPWLDWLFPQTQSA